MLGIHPIKGIAEISPGVSVATVLGDALERSELALRSGDILAVTQKIVSKAEDKFVDLGDVEPTGRSLKLAETTHKDPRLVELILRESTDVLRALPGLLIVRHRLGLVMANAGIDKSNIGPGSSERVLLLPDDPDQSARDISIALKERFGITVPVVITDSFGRPWRHGVTGVAIGMFGMPALLDRRGMEDRDGRLLEVTQVALGDMIAGAVMLVTGEGAEGIPAVVIRGLAYPGNGVARDLIRPLSEDQFQ